VDCVAYVRVSTERQAGEDKTSLADQRRAIGAMSSVVGEWFVDEGVSGGTAEKRPGFMQLVAFCESHPRRDGSVLVLNDSRWGRFTDPEEASYWRVRLSKAGWRVRFVENDATTDPTTRTLMRAIGSATSSATREAIKANARRGAQGTAEKGFWGRREPFGFRRQVVSGGKPRTLEPGERKTDAEKVKLIPYSPEAKIVRELFDRYAIGGESLGALNAWLRRVSPTRRKWSRSVIAVVLKNPAYVGDVAVNGITTRDAHPRIVTRDVYARVQARLVGNRRARRAVRATYPLSGMVRCADCGQTYSGAGGKGQTMYRYYMDAGVYPKYDKGRSEHACPGRAGMIRKEVLEDTVVRVVARELSRPQAIRDVTDAIDRALAAKDSASWDTARDAKKRLEEITRERNRIVQAIASGALYESEASALLRGLRTEADQLAAHANTPPRIKPRQNERQRLLRMALDFPRVAPRLSGASLRNVLMLWVAGATFDKHTRRLSVVLRRVPGVLELSHPPRPERLSKDYVVRTVRIPRGRAA
jgi:DNA invertase Pin-like site-specific DNA recombinase